MGFRINNNITALIAQGNLQKNQNSLTTSIERLSSGLRINRGADDAAGLTISEKLRGQIRGLNRAILNAQDGISLIQTAEGALNEDAAILNRMRELAVQSSNDTLTTNDRLEIQKEIDQLVDEIDRIANTTEFNTKKLLDGTATALVSANAEGLNGIQVGSTRESAGDYSVEINMSNKGAREKQASNILRTKEDQSIVNLDTKLGAIETFYDNEGNNILRTPMEFTVRGNSAAASLTLSSDVSINEFVENLEALIKKDVRQGGLGIKNTDVSFDQQLGQIVMVSGKEGASGEISFSTDEDLIKAFGFQQVVPASDPAYRATAIQLGVQNPIRSAASTTTDRFSGIIPGVDLQFQPPTNAMIEANLNPERVIRTGDTGIQFSFADTNSEVTEITRSDIVNVSLPANTTFTLTSIQTIINESVRLGRNVLHGTGVINSPGYSYGGADVTYTPPSIRATFQGDNLVLTSGLNGTSAKISIFNVNSQAVNVLGIQNGTFIGDEGEAARIIGTKDVSLGTNIGATALDFSVRGPDGRLANIFFPASSNISPVSITATINNALRGVNVRAEATLDVNGSIVLTSLELGEDTNISLVTNAGNLADLGLVNGASANGRGGSPARFTGKTNASFAEYGYTFDTTTAFEISDQYGARSGIIGFGTKISVVGGIDTYVATSNNVTMSQTSIAAVLNSSGLRTTDVGYGFDNAGRLNFYTKSAGQDSRILLQSVSPLSIPSVVGPGIFTSSTSQTSLLSTFGINGAQVATGAGLTKYTVHVSDRSFILQIGANENQILGSSIANFSSKALGLEGLDVTSFGASNKALGAIDRAVNKVSSERSKLGSLQNRLTNTINNLTVTTTNLQAAESRIRDVDIASETVNFTRNQILIQAGTAQLAQANALPQQALQLLGG